MYLYSNIELWKISVPFFGAIIAWLANERRKRAWEEYERKERHYQELVKAIKGFYGNHPQPEAKSLKNHFIEQLNLCWLYSSDSVIQLGYAFLESTRSTAAKANSDKEEALGALMLEIRKDLLKRRITTKTRLQKSDFRLLTSA